jgi:hypothetical protein
VSRLRFNGRLLDSDSGLPAGVLFDFNAALGLEVIAGRVASWVSLPDGNSVLQATAANRPLYVPSSAFGGAPTVSFLSTHFIRKDGLVGGPVPQPLTCVLVFNWPATNRRTVDGGQAPNRQIIGTNTVTNQTLRLFMGSNQLAVGCDPTTGQRVILTVRYSAGVASARAVVAGGTIKTGSCSPGNGGLNGVGFGSPLANIYVGDIARFTAWPRLLSDLEVAGIESRFGDLYDVHPN